MRLPPAAPSANLAKAPDGMLSEHYWTHDKIEMLREDLARIPQVNIGTGRVTGDALALSSLYLNKVEVICMWDLGCTPPALVESSQLQKWNEARVSVGLDPLATTYFDTPRKISGIGSEATTIIGSVMLPLTFQSRPLTVQAIVMTNGNTGVSDVIIGNHHCRLLWDALQSKEEMIIRKPPDGGEPMRIPIDWRMTRLPQAALTQPQLIANQSFS